VFITGGLLPATLLSCGSTQSLTETATRIFPPCKERPARKAVKLTAHLDTQDTTDRHDLLKGRPFSVSRVYTGSPQQTAVSSLNNNNGDVMSVLLLVLCLAGTQTGRMVNERERIGRERLRYTPPIVSEFSWRG
jgi:hypothetical protein